MPRFFRDPARLSALKTSLRSYLKKYNDRPRYVGELSLELKISIEMTEEVIAEMGEEVKRHAVGEDDRGVAISLA